MSEEKQTPEQDPSTQDEGTQSVNIARAVQSRTNWANRTVSPWVQRALRTQASPTGRRRGVTLSERHTRPLVERLQRTSQGRQRVWRPDAGPAPRQPLRFGGEIVQRHQPVGKKYRVETSQAGGGVEMPLAGGATLGEEASAPGMTPSLAPSIRPSMPPSPPSPPSFVPPTMQRIPVEPSFRRAEPLVEFGDQLRPKTERPAAQERQTRPIRPMSRIEELTPGSVQRAPVPPSEPKAEDVAKEEQAPDVSLMPEEEIATSLQRDAEPQIAEGAADQEIHTAPVGAPVPSSIGTEPSLPLTVQETPTPPVPAEARPTVAARPEARTPEPTTSRMERPEPPALPLAVQRQADEEAEEETAVQPAPETAMRAPEPPALPLAVQRQADEEAEEETAVQPAPETAMRAPEPPALPLAVQRQADEEAEEEAEVQPAPQAVMREEEGTPDVQRAPAPDGTLLARMASRAQLPLFKRQEARTHPSGYGALARSMPVQRTAILPQARFEETPSWGGVPGQPGRSDPWAGTAGERLPAPAMTRMPVQRAAAEQIPTTSVVVRRSPDVRGEMPLPPIMTIQRQPTTSLLDSSSISTVQRVVTGQPGTTEQKEEGRSEQDLDKLAREVYPHIVRMLAIERERRIGRW